MSVSSTNRNKSDRHPNHTHEHYRIHHRIHCTYHRIQSPSHSRDLVDMLLMGWGRVAPPVSITTHALHMHICFDDR